MMAKTSLQTSAAPMNGDGSPQAHGLGQAGPLLRGGPHGEPGRANTDVIAMSEARLRHKRPGCRARAGLRGITLVPPAPPRRRCCHGADPKSKQRN